MSKSVYEIITEAIIAKLEAGVIPWRKPWTGSAATNAPRNLVTGKAYRGINIILLSMQGYTCPYWMTFKQVTEKGGTVKKGEKGSMVVYYGKTEGEDENGNEKEYMFLKYYKVFNLEQCEGITAPIIEAPAEEPTFNPIEAAEAIIAAMPQRPEIRHREQRAYYSPTFDYVNMPQPETFIDHAAYYSVLFHELTHSTLHPSRLNRKVNVNYFGGHEDRSKEELCAEMGAAFLSAETGIEATTLENSAAYIQSWLKALKNDKTMLVKAAGQAQKAADFILNRKPAQETKTLPKAA